MMGGFVLYASFDNPQLELVEIELQDVRVKDVNSIENSVKLEVTFLVKNPSEKTFTVPTITYELFSEGNLLGSGQYSTQDVAMPGRAAFYPGSEIPLSSNFYLLLENTNSEIYQKIINGEDLKFSAEGMIVSESAWSLIEKDFQTSM